MVFTMSAKKARDVRTQRNDLQTICAGKIERRAGEFGGDSVAFEGRGNFGVLKHDAVREAAISDKGAKPVNGGFEAMGGFVVGDRNGVQV